MRTLFLVIADYPFQWNSAYQRMGADAGSLSGKEKPMSRLAVPARDDVPEASKPILDARA
jgi:hypothetical protein